MKCSYRCLLTDALFFNNACAHILKKFLKNPPEGAAIFIYHLVCSSDWQPFLKSAELSRLEIDLFKKHMQWLVNEGFSFMTIDELAGLIINKKDMRQKLIAITFDDGFKVTIDNTLPVLDALKIKATFFITTDWIDSKELLWQQRDYWRINNRRPMPDEKDIAASIYPASKDILRLHAAGMQVGSHSCGHYYMQDLPDDLYLEELVKSKQRLEALIKSPVNAFSYPFNSYRDDSSLIEKAGYKVLCTVEGRRVDRSSSLARLPRFDAPARNILFKNSLRRMLYF